MPRIVLENNHNNISRKLTGGWCECTKSHSILYEFESLALKWQDVPSSQKTQKAWRKLKPTITQFLALIVRKGQSQLLRRTSFAQIHDYESTNCPRFCLRAENFLAEKLPKMIKKHDLYTAARISLHFNLLKFIDGGNRTIAREEVLNGIRKFVWPKHETQIDWQKGHEVSIGINHYLSDVCNESDGVKSANRILEEIIKDYFCQLCPVVLAFGDELPEMLDKTVSNMVDIWYRLSQAVLVWHSRANGESEQANIEIIRFLKGQLLPLFNLLYRTKRSDLSNQDSGYFADSLLYLKKLPNSFGCDEPLGVLKAECVRIQREDPDLIAQSFVKKILDILS